jgi:hypothetical protein
MVATSKERRVDEACGAEVAGQTQMAMRAVTSEDLTK